MRIQELGQSEASLSQAQETFGAVRSTEATVLTGQLSVKVSGTDTGGAFAVFELPTLPFAGPPLHLYHAENGWFYTLDGEHNFQVGDKIYRVAPCGSIFAPKMIPHTWQNVGDSPERMLVLVQPAGRLEAFFVLFSKLDSTGALSMGAAKALFEEYDMKVVGPPLPRKCVKQEI